MKKCQKTEKGYLSNRRHKLATQDYKAKFKIKLNRLKELYLIKKIEKPSAPHNTTQYIMDQHPLNIFNSDELLGSVLWITVKIQEELK